MLNLTACTCADIAKIKLDYFIQDREYVVLVTVKSTISVNVQYFGIGRNIYRALKLWFLFTVNFQLTFPALNFETRHAQSVLTRLINTVNSRILETLSKQRTFAVCTAVATNGDHIGVDDYL